MARRFAAWLTLLILALSSAARAGTLCVSLPEFCALIDDQGGEIIPVGRLDALFELIPGALYAGGSAGAYSLYDAQGDRVSGRVFSMICADGDGLIFVEDGLFGCMNEMGEVVVSPEWTQLIAAGDGWLALDQDPLDDQSDELLRIEADGEVVNTGVFVSGGLSRMRCGRMPYRTSDGRCGAVDAMGRAVISPQWRYIGPFIDELALVTGDDGRGLIDVDGTIVIEPDYAWLDRNELMILGQRSDGGADVYDARTAELLCVLPGPLRSVGLAGSCVCAWSEGASYLYSAEGRRLIMASVQAAFSPGAGEQVIVSDGAWGEACAYAVNPDGTVLPGRYQRLMPLGESLYAYMVMDGAEYYSAELRAFQKSWDYDSQRYGLMSAAGEILTDAVYRQILPIGGNRLLLLDDEAVRLADLEGGVLRKWVRAEAGAASAEAGGGGTE